MILLNGPNTPFGRMALVTALELGLAVENRVITVAAAEWLDAANPLRQIPTLLLDTGDPVFDSRVICTYFAMLAGAADLVPADVHVQTRWALVLGLMEAGVARQMERIRPAGEQSPAAITACERRIGNSIARLEAEADAICDGLGRIDRIAAAAALDYIDFRYPHDWRAGAPRLAAWLADVLARPNRAATRPR
jgi:glutathione S-transferase